MKRREFITLLVGSSVAGWPLAARAQQPVTPVIGYLSTEAADLFEDRMRAFREGLGERGYVEGQNVSIEYRFGKGQTDALPAMAADLVAREVKVIAAPTTPSVLAAKRATTTIPIVFAIGSDPVQLDLVRSLNRPGGNVTGVTFLTVELVPKLLELLHDVIPTTTSFALLINPANPSLAEPATRSAQTAARTLGLELRVLEASTERELDAVLTLLKQHQVAALVIGPDPFFTTRSDALGELARRYEMPAIFQSREFVLGGGLMGYGASIVEANRLAGIYAGRILDGEKPSELPVQQSTKVELIVNLKTARSLGLTVPLPLLARADEVIE
jgi:putative tryptophan/tyrosine transport system substrate-binding protein